MNEDRLWTKEFIFVSMINFLSTAIFYLLVVIIGVYAKEEYHASTSLAGLVTGIFIIGTLIGRLFVGRSIGSIGYKRTLLIGTTLFSISSLLYFIHINIAYLLLIRLVHGVTMGMVGTATGTIVAQIIPNQRKGEGIGYYSMSATLATAIGPFLGMLLTEHTTYGFVFSLCLALGLVSFVISLFVHVPEIMKTIKKEEIKGLKLSSFIEPKAIPISTVILIGALCYSGVLSFINFYGREIQLVEAASFFFLVYSIAILFSRPFTGRLMDRKGANYVMYPGFLLFIIGMVLFSIAQNSFILLASGVLMGLGYGNIQSVSQAIAIKRTPIHRMGLATSTYFIFLDAGLGFGPYLLGFIVTFTDYRTLYLITAIIIVFATLLYFLLHGRKEKKLNMVS